MLRTSAKSCIGCHAQGYINITKNVVRAISILPGSPCTFVLHTNHVKTTMLKHCFFVLKNDLDIQQFFFFQAAVADTLSRKKKIVKKTPQIQAGTHSTILCKPGNGRHVYICSWPHLLTKHMGVKHCKCMASLYKHMENTLGDIS